MARMKSPCFYCQHSKYRVNRISVDYVMLCDTRASLGKTAESMLEFLAKNGKEYWATATENTDEVPVHGLPHVLIACLAYNTPPEIQGKNHGCATAFKDISWAQPTLADFMTMGPSNLHVCIYAQPTTNTLTIDIGSRCLTYT